MLWKRWCVIGALLLAAVDAIDAQAARAPSSRNGSWSAATRSGATFLGTWTADLDTAGTVTGTWVLEDAQGNRRADGTWSAAKAPNGWAGAWRALVVGRQGEVSGTWTATLAARPGARLADLFATALQTIVSGTWRVAGQPAAAGPPGAWSIRTFQ